MEIGVYLVWQDAFLMLHRMWHFDKRITCDQFILRAASTSMTTYFQVSVTNVLPPEVNCILDRELKAIARTNNSLVSNYLQWL